MGGEDDGGGLPGGVESGAVVHEEIRVRLNWFLERLDGAFQQFYVVSLDYCIKPAGEHRDEVIWRGLREVGRGWGG